MDASPTNPSSDETLSRQVDTAVGILRGGGVVVVPTDTLYGLAACAFDERGVRRIFSIKGRPASKALPLLLGDSDDIPKYAAGVSELAWTLIERFLPGRLTLVLRSAEKLPPIATGGSGTVALRVPDHWVPRALARRLGAPITGTSANRSGMPGVTTAGEARDRLGGEIDLAIDAGVCPGGVASTVLDVSGLVPIVIREGAVSREEIEDACGQSVALAR